MKKGYIEVEGVDIHDVENIVPETEWQKSGREFDEAWRQLIFAIRSQLKIDRFYTWLNSLGSKEYQK